MSLAVLHAVPFFLLLLPLADAVLPCVEYSYYPIDKSYYERPTTCQTNFCVKYAVTGWMKDNRKMTFFLGNCDDGHFCRKGVKGFNSTLTPDDFYQIFGQTLHSGVTKIRMAGECCSQTYCNRLKF